MLSLAKAIMHQGKPLIALWPIDPRVGPADANAATLLLGFAALRSARMSDSCFGSPTDQVDGLISVNLWSPPPSSTDMSTSEAGREEVCQEAPLARSCAGMVPDLA